MSRTLGVRAHRLRALRADIAARVRAYRQAAARHEGLPLGHRRRPERRELPAASAPGHRGAGVLYYRGHPAGRVVPRCRAVHLLHLHGRREQEGTEVRRHRQPGREHRSVGSAAEHPQRHRPGRQSSATRTPEAQARHHREAHAALRQGGLWTEVVRPAVPQADVVRVVVLLPAGRAAACVRRDAERLRVVQPPLPRRQLGLPRGPRLCHEVAQGDRAAVRTQRRVDRVLLPLPAGFLGLRRRPYRLQHGRGRCHLRVDRRLRHLGREPPPLLAVLAVYLLRVQGLPLTDDRVVVSFCHLVFALGLLRALDLLPLLPFAHVPQPGLHRGIRLRDRRDQEVCLRQHFRAAQAGAGGRQARVLHAHASIFGAVLPGLAAGWAVATRREVKQPSCRSQS
mmetsp:Transcript_95463/g.275026  ORF Transcript_95463/g.275026 Transcript_95463/m.275026 type:complete len:396 (-) Transcript_95463:154-1341(-)